MYYAQFNDSFPPLTDGVAQTALNYALWLNRKHGKCCVVTPQHPQACDHQEFEVMRFASMPLFVVKDYKLGLPDIAFKTFHRLDTLPLDLVHSHCPFASGSLALMIARKKNIPVVATFHTKFADDFAQRLKMENAGKIAAKYTAKYFSQADEVWAVNAASAETLHEYGYRGPVTVMPNGCDFAPMERTNEIRRKVLKQYGLGDKPLLLFVGRLVEQKNVSFLIKSLNKLKETGDFNVILVGDGEGAPAYQKQAAEFGIADRFMFIGSVQDREELRRIYAASDLFLLPSVYDNAPLVVREAASCGCPSVLIANSNAAEGITDGVNGFTSELKPDAYAEVLSHLLANPALIRSAGSAAQETVYVSWERIVDRVADEYKRVITDYGRKKSTRRKRQRYISIPAVFARDIFNRQAVRIRFTARHLDRQSKQRTAEMQKKNMERLKVFKARLLEARKRSLK
jgi:1,2-diacylglycerol 3-alpha-glucosyltransferase